MFKKRELEKENGRQVLDILTYEYYEHSKLYQPLIWG